eukprot:COSAG02_NODE_7630_length_2925_cov_11.518401_5_plen_69_part_00
MLESFIAAVRLDAAALSLRHVPKQMKTVEVCTAATVLVVRNESNPAAAREHARAPRRAKPTKRVRAAT